MPSSSRNEDIVFKDLRLTEKPFLASSKLLSQQKPVIIVDQNGRPGNILKKGMDKYQLNIYPS